jgi:type IV pilus assembly protein PilX
MGTQVKASLIHAVRVPVRLRTGTTRLPRRQRGVVLFIALIALVAMTLAGIAMMRSVDTTLGIAGNMAFRQTTIQSGELGLQAAYNWLQTQTLLSNDLPANGYYSSATEPDWFNINTWNNKGILVNGGVPDAAGNVTQYLINRMCTLSGQSYSYVAPAPQVSQSCSMDNPLAGSQAGNSAAVGATGFPGQPLVYFRVTVRVDGPRNTVSVTQTNILMLSS